MISTRTNELLERVEKLEARNRRVEGDKAWETSWTGRISIMALTVIGFVLSTLTISVIKKEWLAKRNVGRK